MKIRRTVVCHPYTVRRELAELVTGAPWYATARPFAIIPTLGTGPVHPDHHVREMGRGTIHLGDPHGLGVALP